MYVKDPYEKGKGLFYNLIMWVVLIKYLTFCFVYRISQKELNRQLRFPEGLELFAGLHDQPHSEYDQPHSVHDKLIVF